MAGLTGSNATFVSRQRPRRSAAPTVAVSSKKHRPICCHVSDTAAKNDVTSQATDQLCEDAGPLSKYDALRDREKTTDSVTS
jgi:hypothetical protein